MPRRPTIDPDIFNSVQRDMEVRWTSAVNAAGLPNPPDPPAETHRRRLDRFGLVEGTMESMSVAREIRALQERLRRRDERRAAPTDDQRLQRAMGARKERLRLVHWLQAIIGDRSGYSGRALADMIQRRDHWSRLNGPSEREFDARAAEQETARCPRADREIPW